MKKPKNKIYGALVCILLALSLVINVQAATTSEKVDSAEKEVQESQKKLQETQKSIQELQDNKDQLEGSLDSLNSELNAVSTELTNLQKDLKTKQSEIEKTEQELAKAREQEQIQYQDMKIRIKYMYEMKDSTFMEIIMEGGSFADILNKAEYFTKVTEYDRDMLKSYKETKEAIEKNSATLEQERANLEQMIAQVGEKQQSVSMLASQIESQVAQKQGDLNTAEAKALEYEKQLEEQLNTLEALKAQEALEKAIREAEERARREAASGVSKSSNSTGSVPETSLSEGKFKIMTSYAGYELAGQSSDLDVMAAIIYCESGGEPYEGKIAVGSVIMNRINSVYFPNTLRSVLFQQTQFTPVVSGRFSIVLETKKASAECYQAAQEVLNGVNNVPDCLFFRTVIPEKQGLIIGGHVFY